MSATALEYEACDRTGADQVAYFHFDSVDGVYVVHFNLIWGYNLGFPCTKLISIFRSVFLPEVTIDSSSNRKCFGQCSGQSNFRPLSSALTTLTSNNFCFQIPHQFFLVLLESTLCLWDGKIGENSHRVSRVGVIPLALVEDVSDVNALRDDEPHWMQRWLRMH